jgi:type IV pilus assembly protein PilC
MIYKYEAYNKDKKIIRGSIESSSEDAAEGILYRAGFDRIIRLKEANSSANWRQSLAGKPKVSQQALLDFTNELAIMLESGLSLHVALKQMEKMSSSRSLRDILAAISANLKAGRSLHEAMMEHPQVFSQTYCSMIEANETTGTLDSGLRQIAKELKQQVETRAQIQQALTQPAIVIVVGIAVVLILTVYVLPRLLKIFTQLNVPLPTTTKILIGVTNFVSGNIVNIGLAVLILIVAGLLFYRSPSGKIYLDKLMLRLPMVGEVVLWHYIARFSRTLSNLLRAGILLPDAMNVILRSMKNSQISTAVSQARTRLIQGQSLSAVLANDPVFPRFLVEMTVIGESSGALEASLGTVADYFENRVSRRLTRLTALLEPALIVILGLGVGFVAVTMISTIYGMLGGIK